MKLLLFACLVGYALAQEAPEGNGMPDYSKVPYDAGNFEGDIVVPKGGGSVRNAISNPELKWPKDNRGHVIVPYDFHTSASASAKHGVRAAAFMYAENTCIRFVERTNEKDYITVFNGAGCFSSVGDQRAGKQGLSLGYGCESRGVAAHEMMHAVGFWHEQSRPDRDDWITIVTDNIKQGKEHNFKKCDDCVTQNLPYDYESIMHYGDEFFTKQDGLKTMVPKRAGKIIGHRSDFSPLDVKKLNKLYDCSASAINDDAQGLGSDGCAFGWERVGSKCYLDTWEAYSHADATAHCRSKGAGLPSPSSASEQQQFKTYMTDNGIYATWLGFKASNGEWQNTSGRKVSYTKWKYGDQGADNGRCAQYNWGDWYSYGCEREMRIVCEKDVGSTGGGGGGGSGSCSDKMDCTSYVKSGLCSQSGHRESMQYWCPRSCNMC